MENYLIMKKKKQDNLKYICGGIMENNNEVLKRLITSLEKTEEEIIDVDILYGIFFKNNKFIICKEKVSEYRDEIDLQEFFTKETIEFQECRLGRIFYPWQEKIHFFFMSNTLGYCVPVRDLLGKLPSDAQVSGTDISNLYKNVNKYIKKHPNFIEDLFNAEKEKTR